MRLRGLLPYALTSVDNVLFATFEICFRMVNILFSPVSLSLCLPVNSYICLTVEAETEPATATQLDRKQWSLTSTAAGLGVRHDFIHDTIDTEPQES